MTSESPALNWTLGKIRAVDIFPLYTGAGIICLWLVLVLITSCGNDCCRLKVREWLYSFEESIVLMVFNRTVKKKEDGTITVFELNAKSKSRTVHYFFLLFQYVLFLAIFIFWDVFLFDTTSTDFCVPGKACFMISKNTSDSSYPINCLIDRCNPIPHCNQSTDGLICYELVLDYGKAAGIAAGLFKISTFIVFVVSLCLQKALKKGLIWFIVSSVFVAILPVALAALLINIDVLVLKTFENDSRLAEFVTTYLSFVFAGYTPLLVRLSDLQNTAYIAINSSSGTSSRNYATAGSNDT